MRAPRQRGPCQQSHPLPWVFPGNQDCPCYSCPPLLSRKHTVPSIPSRRCKDPPVQLARGFPNPQLIPFMVSAAPPRCCPKMSMSQSCGVGTGSQFCLQRGHWDSLPTAGRSHVPLLLCLTRENPLTPHPKTLRIKRFLLPNSQLVMLPHRPRRLVRAISSSTDQKNPISPPLPGTDLPKGP